MADVTDVGFEQEVIKSEIPVMVDFWAPWCAPCRIISPVVEELGKEYEGKLKVFKMNVDDNPDSASKYNVMSIPTVMVFKGGEPVKTMVGVQPKENMKREIDEAIAS